MKVPHLMKMAWWKILGGLIFLYVIIGGMTTPLNPGITRISPDQTTAGNQVEFNIKGYNTNYSKDENHAWIKVDDSHMIKAYSTEVLDDNTLKASFDLPTYFPGEGTTAYGTVITYNAMDGAAIRPDGIYIKDIKIGLDNKWQSSFGMQLIKPDGIRFPFRSILDETIRNTFFHVAIWLAMVVLLLIGLYYAIRYLISKEPYYDLMSASFNRVAILYGIFGLITGSIWARFTWGTWWTSDIKLNMSAIAMLIYLAYLILRSATEDYEKRARLSGVYTIFAFAVLIPLIFVIPRLTDSLHPGNGGNPALGGEDLDNTLRLFFYPSIIGLILIGTWIAFLLFRYDRIEEKVLTD